LAILLGALASAIILGPLLLGLNSNGSVTLPRISSEPSAGEEGAPLKQVENWPTGLHVDPSTLATHKQHEGKDYLVWHYTPAGGASAQQFLVDSTGTPQDPDGGAAHGGRRQEPRRADGLGLYRRRRHRRDRDRLHCRSAGQGRLGDEVE